MPEGSADVVGSKRYARSRVSNGSSLLSGVDGRSCWARRLRDLIELHQADRGGQLNISEAERAIIRRASTLIVEAERLEAKFALAGEAEPADLDLYQRLSNSMRRLFESVGIERRPRDVTPALNDYVAGLADKPEAAG
jgi:hypothetical protein